MTSTVTPKSMASSVIGSPAYVDVSVPERPVAVVRDEFNAGLVFTDTQHAAFLREAAADRHPHARDKMAVRVGGREALTYWEVLERYSGTDGAPVASLLALLCA